MRDLKHVKKSLNFMFNEGVTLVKLVFDDYSEILITKNECGTYEVRPYSPGVMIPNPPLDDEKLLSDVKKVLFENPL